MARPTCCRRIAGGPVVSVFLPAGVPEGEPSEMVLTLDEFEAIRLADLEGLYQEQAAERMAVSRPTFGRILATAHRKVAGALVHGDTLKIGGGTIRVDPARSPICACPRCRLVGAESDAGVSVESRDAEGPACPELRRRRAGCRENDRCGSRPFNRRK
jgi:predicted DNA-binding protein (UPF0251 family)